MVPVVQVREGGRGGTCTAVALAHEVQMNGWSKREFRAEYKQGLAQNCKDEEGYGNGGGGVGYGGDADDEGGKQGNAAGYDGEAAAVGDVVRHDDVHDKQVSPREHKQVAETVTRLFVESGI